MRLPARARKSGSPARAQFNPACGEYNALHTGNNRVRSLAGRTRSLLCVCAALAQTGGVWAWGLRTLPAGG